MKMKVEDIQVGDLVDLESCPQPALREHETAEFELFDVVEIEKQGANILIGFESIAGLFTFQRESELVVERPVRK